MTHTPTTQETTAHHTTLALLCLATTLLLTACPKPPPIPRYSSVPGSQAPNEDDGIKRWSINLPKDLDRVRLHATTKALFVTADKKSPDMSFSHVLLCLDPGNGAIRWVHTLEENVTQRRPDLFFITDKHFIVAQRQQAIAIDRANGKIAWRYSDPDNKLPIYAATQAPGLDNTLILSLGNRRLVTLSLTDGTPTHTHTVRDDTLKAVTQTPQGLLALTISAPDQDQKTPALTAHLLDDQHPDPLWQRPISSWNGDLHIVADTILGQLIEGEMWALELTTGKDRWHTPLSDLPGEPIFLRQKLLFHKTQLKDDKPTAVTLTATAPHPLPSSQQPHWSRQLLVTNPLLGVEEQPNSNTAFGATGDLLFTFDTTTGKELRRQPFVRDNEPDYWTNASSDGQTFYLYFGRQHLLQSR